MSCPQGFHPPKDRAKRRDGPIDGLGEGIDLNVEILTVMAHSLEEIWSEQAEVMIVQAGSE